MPSLTPSSTQLQSTTTGGVLSVVFFLWTSCLVVLVLACIVSGQGLSHAELTEPVGPQQKKDIADMFNTNPNRLYDDFDGNTIYHKFHPIDDYVPPLPLTSTPNVSLTNGGTIQTVNMPSSGMNYRPSLENETEGFDSNANLRKASGPIEYQYNIIPSRPRSMRLPKTPPSPITISSSSSPEPDNDIVKRQTPNSMSGTSSSGGSQSIGPPSQNVEASKYPRYEIRRPPPTNGDNTNLPAFELLQPGRSASFIPLRVIPTTNSQGPIREPYNSYGIYTSLPNTMHINYPNTPVFVPVPGNSGVAQHWIPRTRPAYLPPPNVAPAPSQFNYYRNQDEPRRATTGPGLGLGANQPIGRNDPGQMPPAYQPWQNSPSAFEPRPQLIGRQLRFPTPIPFPPGYTNGAPQQPNIGIRNPVVQSGGSLFSPRPGVPEQQFRQPPPTYRQFIQPHSINPAMNMNSPPNRWNPSPYGGSGSGGMYYVIPPPPSYESTVAVRPSFPSSGPYYNQSPRMGYFLPPPNSGQQFVGRQPSPYPFTKQEAAEPSWQGSGQGPPSFNAGQRSRQAPYYIPQQAQQGLYPPTGHNYGYSYPGEQSRFQPPAYRGPSFGANGGENRRTSWAGPTATTADQPFYSQLPAVPAGQPELQPTDPTTIGGNVIANINSAVQPPPTENMGHLVGSRVNISRPGGFDPTGLRTEQKHDQLERTPADTQSTQVPDLSVNRGPVPFYSQADVDSHYRRMLAHNETTADSEFENDPRVLQWYLQRAKQVVQERRRATQGSSTGGGNINNAQSNGFSSVQPGGFDSVPTSSVSNPISTSSIGQQSTANETASTPNQQWFSSGN